MNGTDVGVKVDGSGYWVKLRDGRVVDVHIDLDAIETLAYRALRNRTGRAVAGPCKATARRERAK